jgi:hypothetical protein
MGTRWRRIEGGSAETIQQRGGLNPNIIITHCRVRTFSLLGQRPHDVQQAYNTFPVEKLRRSMADSEEVHYERERSRSRDRGDNGDYNDRDARGESQEDGGYRREKSDGDRPDESQVFNLYITNLSFQVHNGIFILPCSSAT